MLIKHVNIFKVEGLLQFTVGGILLDICILNVLIVVGFLLSTPASLSNKVCVPLYHNGELYLTPAYIKESLRVNTKQILSALYSATRIRRGEEPSFLFM